MSLSPSRTAAYDILIRVERGSFSDDLLHSERLDALSPADRALATEIVMGVLRWRSSLDDLIAKVSSQPPAKLDLEVLIALRMGTYQLKKLHRVPAHAAINQSVELVKRARKRSAAPFVNAVLRKLAQSKLELDADPIRAHPAWLVERWEKRFGLERTRAICQYDQQVPPTTIRLRDAEAEAQLKAGGIELAPGAFLNRARRVISGDVQAAEVWAEGRVAIQDEASQLVALLVGSGARLLDCCAAPGGKTAILAERNPASLVIAAELHPARARLTQKLVRAGNVRVVAADAISLPVQPDFDRVLADVPCSGTGTLARNPEIKWRLRPEDLHVLNGRQAAILRSALGYLVPGGRLVYSTCSLEREENEDVIAEVVSSRSDVTLLDCRDELRRLAREGELVTRDLDSLLDGKFLRTLPGVHPCDGFFAAVVERHQT